MDNDLSIAFASFCDQAKILKYFKEFRDFLESSENVLELSKMNTFSSTLRVLGRSELFDVLEPTNKENSDGKIQSFAKDFKDILLHILEIFCVKHSKIILQVQDNLQNYTEKAITLDTFAYLIKKFIVNDTKFFGHIESLIENISDFLIKVTQKMANYTVISESELAPLFYAVLKFVAKVFQCVPNDNADYFSDPVIINLITNIPLTDSTTVKLFVNYILPAIITFSKESFKALIFKCIWQDICLQFQLITEQIEGEAFDAYSCVYTLLCCLSECIYHTREIGILIHNEMVFWQIIMSGLTSNFPFTRKKSLNVFKMFLARIVTHDETLNGEIVLSPYTFSGFKKDMKIWNDVITLFESLEEKQVYYSFFFYFKFLCLDEFKCKINTLKFYYLCFYCLSYVS